MKSIIYKTPEFESGFKIFNNYLERIEFQTDKKNSIYVYYSGGKDASLLIDFFLQYKLRYKMKFEIVLLTIRFPSMIYNSEEKKQKERVNKAITYWISKGLRHQWMEVEEVNDFALAESTNPCNICESVKIKSMDKEMEKDKYDGAMICLGHTLDDITGYLSELFYIAGAYKSWEYVRRDNPVLLSRMLKLSRWVYLTYSPFGVGKNFVYIKPLMLLEEQLIKRIVEVEGYPLIPECCATLMGNRFQLYKRIVNKGINWIDNQYRNDSAIYDKLLYKDYDLILKKYMDIGILPSLEYIESVKI